MLNGIRIYTNDNIWRKILTDLGASVTPRAIFADIDFDSLEIPRVVHAAALGPVILKAVEDNHRKISTGLFGKAVALPPLQMRIVAMLAQSGGMSASDLKDMLGYSADIATHAADTAIYNLRKAYGRDFIRYENGKYFIGEALL